MWHVAQYPMPLYSSVLLDSAWATATGINMKRKVIIVLVLVFLVLFIQIQNSVKTEETAALTVVVKDVYGSLIDDAVVSVTYVFPQDDDTDIPDSFTKKGVAVYLLEPDREYIVTITKAGFLPYTERIELEEDTKINITLEYAQKVPILHMKRFSVTPHQVAPGEQFQVYVVVENEGTGDALNVKVTFDPAQNFSPVQPSSSAYWERLDTQKITSVTQTFAVSGECLSGIYDLVLTITYQDSQGLSYTVQETVGVSILRKPLVKLLNVDYPREVTQGEAFIFSVEVANTGRFTVNGLYLEVKSDMDWEYYSYYVGSLEAGDYDSFESKIVSKGTGEHTFVIRIGFTDDFNQEHIEEQSFSLYVTERVEETPPPQENEGLWNQIVQFFKSLLGLD